MKSYKQMVNEVLTKSTPAGEWIKDFVGSDNPKFAGKSAAKRKQMALAAYYSKQEESYAGSQNSTAIQDMEAVEQIDEGENGLAAKSKKSGISLSTLKTVYKRGVAAWNSGHRPGTTPQQWGMARVNSYITKGSGTYGGADKDLHEDARLDKTEYHKGMSDSTAKARVAHWKKADKLSDSNPKAYEPAPGDKTAKTTPSVHTKKYHAMYGEGYEHGPIDRDAKVGVGHKAAVLAGSGLDSGKHGTIVGSSKERTGDMWHIKTASGDIVKMHKHRVAKLKEETVEEAKVYDPFTKKMVATKPIKVQAGGGATRNGVPVETGPSKYKSKLPMSKAAAVLAAEEVELIDEISKQTADSYLSKVTKDQVGKHGMQPNMFDKLPKNRQQGVSNALKRLISPERPSRPGDIHGKSFTEEVKIDEVSKSTLMRYIPKASRDVADNVAMAKERQVTMVHATHAGNYDMANKESDKSKVSFKKAMQRIKGIDTATKKLGTQKEETEQIDELSKGLVARYANKVAKTTQDNYDKSKDKFQFSSSRQDGMKNAVKRLTKEEVELDEAIAKKLPVQHAVDAVHATLGPKSATRFLSHLSPGSDKHTSWDKVNDALVKQGVQTHHIASIAQKTSHMNEEVIDESRGHKVLATFFKNREVAQRAYQGNPAKDAEVAQGGGSPADQGIAAAKRDAEELKKKVNEVKAPAVRAAPPKKTKSTAKEYTKAAVPGTKRVTRAKPDSNEPGESLKEDQYTSEYKIKYYVDPVTGETKTRKIRPHRVSFKASKMRGEPAQQDAQGDYGMKEGDEYDEKWKQYKGKTFKKESRMINFKDYLKEAALSAKQKKIAAIAGEKDKIDAHDLAALRAGKKPVEEASCSSKDMKKEELVGNQHKLDKNKNGKLDAHDFKLLRKEEAEQIDELSKKTLGSYTKKAANDLGDKAHELGQNGEEPDYEDDDDKSTETYTGALRRGVDNRQAGIKRAVNKITKEEAELDEGRVKELAMDLKDMSHDEFHKQYGKPKSHFDPTNFKKPVEPGKGMDRARALAQRGMQSLSKEEVEQVDESSGLPYALHQMGKNKWHIHNTNTQKLHSTYNNKNVAMKKYIELNNKDEKKADKVSVKIANHLSKFSGITKEEVERIEEKLAQLDELSKGTLASYVGKAAKNVKTKTLLRKDFEYKANSKSSKNPEIDNQIAGEFKDEAEKRLGNINKAASKLAKEEVEQEMSPYLKATLKVMDEGKIDNLRDAQKLRQDMKSAYDKDYKPDTSHPHIQVVKGNAYGGANQKDDEGDEKPDETKEKKGRGRPTGSKSGARQKGGGHEDGGIPVHNLNLPKSYK